MVCFVLIYPLIQLLLITCNGKNFNVIGTKTRDKRNRVPFLMETVSSDIQWCWRSNFVFMSAHIITSKILKLSPYSTQPMWNFVSFLHAAQIGNVLNHSLHGKRIYKYRNSVMIKQNTKHAGKHRVDVTHSEMNYLRYLNLSSEKLFRTQITDYYNTIPG